MSKSDYLENKVLDHVLGGGDYSRPATVYVALYSSDPTDANAGTELAGGSYARVAVANNATNWPAAAAGSKSNGTEILFPTATADWTQATHFGLMDSATLGNLLYSGALTTAKTVLNGDIARFAAGSLTITES